MKKLTTILLAALLLLSLTVTAFAAGGTITVKGATKDAVYTLYKIFDVEGDGIYAIPSGKETAYQATASFATLFDVTTSGGKTYVTAKGSAADILAWAKTNRTTFEQIGSTVTATTEGQDVTFSPSADGYYYIDSTATPGAAIVYHVTSNITINEKNSEPGWGDGGKSADAKSYQYGDTVTYTLNYNNALNYSNGAQVVKYIVRDTLPEGLTFDGTTISYQINGGSAQTATVTKSGQSFVAEIPWTQLDAANIPATIQITYTATVTVNATTATTLTNSAKIYPSTDGSDPGPGTTPEKTEDVYTGAIIVDKYDGTTNAKLAGAKFVLKQGAKFYHLNTTENKVEWVDSQDDATVLVTTTTTASNVFSGLEAGSYTLVEIEAPAGYNLPATVETAVTLADTSAAAMAVTQPIANSQAAAMPETGGTGTMLFALFGGTLAVLGMIVIITRKRMKAEI